MHSRFGSFAALIILLLLASVSVGQEPTPWPTNEFEVRWSSTKNDTIYSFNEWIRKKRLNPAERTRLENWETWITGTLKEIAGFYESRGLRPPHLRLLSDSEAGERYLVNVYPFEPADAPGGEGLGLFTTPNCGSVSNLNEIDPSQTTLNANLNDIPQDLPSSRNREVLQLRKALYESLAHEMFHAIQFTYDKQVGSILWCSKEAGNGRAAVVEGTAVAAGVLAADAKFQGYIKNLFRGDLSLGMYPFGGDFEFLKMKSKETETVQLKKDLEYKTSSFWRYLAERFGGLRSFDVLFSRKLVAQGAPTLKDRYEWLNGNVTKITGTEMYILFPEFQAELGSYVEDSGGPESRYIRAGSRDLWLKWLYNPDPSATLDKGSIAGSGCSEVEINENNFFFGEVVYDLNNQIFKNGATCIRFAWSDYVPPALIEVQAVTKSETLSRQVHLGVSRLQSGNDTDNCYDKIKKAGKKARSYLECAFGKTFYKKDDDSTHYRTWVLGTEEAEKKQSSFFERELAGSGSADLVFTNIAKDPNQTWIIPRFSNADAVKIQFSISSAEFFDGRNYEGPVQTQLRESESMFGTPPGMALLDTVGPMTGDNAGFFQSVSFGNLNQVPKIDRYSIYGIKKPAKALPNGLGASFRTVSVDDPTKSYTIAPLDPKYKFEALGKMNAIVSNEKGENSAICMQKYGLKLILNVTKSDKKQLVFEVNADLCTLLPNGEVKKVDRIDAKFTYAFGRRAYPATAPQDVITPGLELYIDEYLKELSRRGVQFPPTVLMSDGSKPGDGGPDTGDNADSDEPTTENRTTDTGACDCSCETYAKIKSRMQNAKRNRQTANEIRSLLACMQVCAVKWKECRDN
ncbi:MAG: hypothetical protein HKN33_02765 [Pyrinomonadaceae bacterium]|nr:hypothetical protein [Pyrinomonadaceae bacterium]